MCIYAPGLVIITKTINYFKYTFFGWLRLVFFGGGGVEAYRATLYADFPPPVPRRIRWFDKFSVFFRHLFLLYKRLYFRICALRHKKQIWQCIYTWQIISVVFKYIDSWFTKTSYYLSEFWFYFFNHSEWKIVGVINII